jgi:hypothetical protein
MPTKPKPKQTSLRRHKPTRRDAFRVVVETEPCRANAANAPSMILDHRRGVDRVDGAKAMTVDDVTRTTMMIPGGGETMRIEDGMIPTPMDDGRMENFAV